MSLHDIVQARQKAHRECLAQIERLVNLHTSSGNTDGSLLSNEEYSQRRGKLLKEKAVLEELLNDAGKHIQQQLKLSEQALEFAYAVKERFQKGDSQTKKAILATMSSNLILKDKKLLIEAKKPFVIIEECLSPETPVVSPIEPEIMPMPQGRGMRAHVVVFAYAGNLTLTHIYKLLILYVYVLRPSP